MSSDAWKRPPTRGQIETLTLLFEGLTERQVAEVRHRAQCSIERAVQALKDKAECPDATIRKLCFEGLRRNWLSPPEKL